MNDEIFTNKIFRVDYGCIFSILRKLVAWKKSAWKHVSHASNKFSNTYQSYVFKRTTKYLVTLPNEGEGKIKLGAGICATIPIIFTLVIQLYWTEAYGFSVLPRPIFGLDFCEL